MNTKIVLCSLAILFVLSFIFFKKKINEGLNCLSYWEQCKAEEIEGLTEEQCLEKKDVVAYLLDKKICLVNRQPF